MMQSDTFSEFKTAIGIREKGNKQGESMINMMINTGRKMFLPSILVEKDRLKIVNFTLELKILQNTLKHVTLTKHMRRKKN